MPTSPGKNKIQMKMPHDNSVCVEAAAKEQREREGNIWKEGARERK